MKRWRNWDSVAVQQLRNCRIRHFRQKREIRALKKRKSRPGRTVGDSSPGLAGGGQQRAMQATVRIESRGPERCVYELIAKWSHSCHSPRGTAAQDEAGDSQDAAVARKHTKNGRRSRADGVSIQHRAGNS